MPDPTAPSPGPAHVPAADAAQRYLALLKQTLTRALFGGELVAYEPARDAPEHALWTVLRDYSPADVALVRRPPPDPEARASGRDWPADADTMIGLRRLDNVQECVVAALREGIPGDLLEAGVWRGGAAILMRAVLAAYSSTDRCVWVADSFQGLPPPDPDRYPADSGDRHWTRGELVVSVDEVRANFERYGLLDDQVRFLVGWFEDTLPACPADQLAVLRIDGDMYGSTIVALRSLYARVAAGGFVIVDDYGAVEACRQAVEDFRDEEAITAELRPIDWTGVYWRKQDRRGSSAPVTLSASQVTVGAGDTMRSVELYSERGFDVAADLYTRAGWHQELFKRTRWLGMPVWQIPEDLLALQELVWRVRPDVVVETGVMHGGSAIFFASLLELLGRGRVMAVDLHLTADTQDRVRNHPLGHRVTLIEGSSTDERVLARVRAGIGPDDRVLVVLDSDHTYAHVAAELDRYGPLVTPGSYIVVCDGIMEALVDAPGGSSEWESDNPARASRDFLQTHAGFQRDTHFERFGATYYPHGFLRRTATDEGCGSGPP